jgi:hypothetical protein
MMPQLLPLLLLLLSVPPPAVCTHLRGAVSLLLHRAAAEPLIFRPTLGPASATKLLLLLLPLLSSPTCAVRCPLVTVVLLKSSWC